MPFINQPDVQSITLPFDQQLAAYLKQGYKIVSDGQSGVQLEKKEMRFLDKCALVFGAVLIIFFWPAAILAFIVVLIDYYLLTKPKTVFLGR